MKKEVKKTDYKKIAADIQFERGRILALMEIITKAIEQSKMTSFIIEKLEDINDNLYRIENRVDK
jgi:hypothetical protein